MNTLRLLSFTAILIFQAIVLNAQIQIGQDIDGEFAGNNSGFSIDMPDISTVSIGAPDNDDGGNDAGHVRVFSLTGGSWVQKGGDLDGMTGEECGTATAMGNNNTVAVGCIYTTSFLGKVQVYSWSGSAWVQKGSDILGLAANDFTGYYIEMPNEDVVATNRGGNVTIFNWNGTAWIQKGNNINTGVGLMSSLSMPDANTVAYGRSTGGNGNTYVYSWNGTAWIQKGSAISGENFSDQSGRSISMANANSIAIGAPNNSDNGTDAGHVRVYDWNGTTWMQRGADIDGEAANDKSGTSVSMADPNTVAIGAEQNDGNGTDAGHVRVYKWNGNSWIQLGNDIDGEAAFDRSGKDIVMPDTSTVAISATFNKSPFSNTGHVRVYQLCSNSTSTISPAACESYTSPSGRYNYTTSATYLDTIPNAAGCDSIVTINLTINNNQTSTLTETACFNYTSPSGNYTYNASGMYNDTIPTQAGCDSIITINLTINTVDTAVSKLHTTATANLAGAAYQWLDCDSNFIAISGETGQSFVATENGNYAVEVTQNGCIDTSRCVSITSVSIDENKLSERISMHPNPTKGKLFIDLQGGSWEMLIIYDLQGKEMLRESILRKDVMELDLDHFAKGTYFLRLEGSDKSAVEKLILE